MATVFRPPVITRIPSRDPAGVAARAAFEVRQNLLLTTLSGADALPLRQLYWPNPRGAEYPVALRSLLGALQIQLIGEDNLPARAYEQPNPVLRLRAVEHVFVSNLLTLTTPVAAPFHVTDWPVPAGARAATELRTWVDPLKINLLGQDSFPSRITDWPNPIPPTYAISLRTWLEPLKIDLVGQDTLPFHQANWPNPIPPTHPIGLRTWLENLKLQLIGKDAIYGAPGQAPAYDWKNPARPIYPTSLLSLLSPGFLEAPPIPPVPVVVPPTTGRRHRGQKRTRQEVEAEERRWKGLPPLLPVVTEDPPPYPRAPAPVPLNIEITVVTRFGLRSSVTASVELSRESSSRLALAPKATMGAELTHRSKQSSFSLVADRSKVVSETIHSGGGGFKFGSKHRVDADLWMDRPITAEEERAILRKLKP